MLRTTQTFNAHAINDGINYRAWLLNPFSLPAAQPVFIPQAQSDSEDTGAFTVEVQALALRIQVLNQADRRSLIAQLQGWFKRGTRGDLVILYHDDGLTYYKPARVVNLVQDPENSLYFTAILQTGWTSWRAVDPDTYTWNLTGTGDDYTLALAGDDETPLSVQFTLGAGPNTGFLFQRLYQLLAVAGVPALGLVPWCIIVDTAALIADNSNKCQLNGSIDASQTTIAYDTVTGSLPSAGLGYLGTEQIKWTGKTGTTSGNLTGVTRGFAGTTAASHADNVEIKLSHIQANCADVRIFVDQQEVNRWIYNPNNASTKFWFNLSLAQSGFSVALGTAITDTADLDTITFAATADVYAAIAAMPAEGILVHGTEWIKYQRVEVGAAVNRLNVIQRGVMNTTKQTHAVGDVFQYMEHVIRVCYGNSSLVSPATLDTHYNDMKPLISLGASSNSAWVYDTTCDLFYDYRRTGRTGGFTPVILLKGPASGDYYWKQNIKNGQPALGMGMVNYLSKAEQAKLAWLFYHAAGFDTTTFAGQKSRTSSLWPAVAALQSSPDGAAFATIWNESPPTSLGVWQALSTHSGDDMGDDRWLRFLFDGVLASGDVYALWEILTGTLNLVSANVPAGSLFTQQLNAQLDLTLTNAANEDALGLDIGMVPGLVLELDGEAKTVLYDHVNAYNIISLNDESRSTWLRLKPGNNPLTIASADVGTLEALLTWYRRRF